MSIRSLNGTLKSLKKEEREVSRDIYCHNLFVGHDFYSILAWQRFKDLHPDENTMILYERPITEEDLWIIGPATIRGQKNLEFLKQKLNLETITTPAVFYKDHEFRSFQGRHRPQKLFFDEEYYTQEGCNIELTSLAGQMGYSGKPLDFVEINQHRISAAIVTINPTIPNDLIEEAHWEIGLSSGQKLKVKNLFWGEATHLFLEMLSEEGKRLATDDFIEYCEKTKSKAMVAVRFFFSEKISDLENTFFVPMCISEEQGHYIGQFYNASEDGVVKQHLDMIMFLDPDHCDEDSLARNIRQMRKTLEKIFNKFEKKLSGEFIFLEQNLECRNIDRVKQSEICQCFKNFFFIGKNALPNMINDQNEKCEDSSIAISGAVRGLHSLEQIQQFRTQC